MINTEVEIQTLWGWKFARDIELGELLFHPNGKMCKLIDSEIITTDAYQLTTLCRKDIARHRIILSGTQKVVTYEQSAVMVSDLALGQRLYQIPSNKWDWVVSEIKPLGMMNLLKIVVDKHYYVVSGASLILGDDAI